MMGDLRKGLETLLNQHSAENGSNTPDYILANFLIGQLDLFDKTVNCREKWYGRETGSAGFVLHRDALGAYKQPDPEVQRFEDEGGPALEA